MAQQMQPAQQQSMFVDVSQLTAAYQIGTVLREYKNTAQTMMVLGIVLTVVGGASMLLSLVLFLYIGFQRVESYLFFLGLALLGYGIARIRAAGRNRGARVYRCTKNLYFRVGYLLPQSVHSVPNWHNATGARQDVRRF